MPQINTASVVTQLADVFNNMQNQVASIFKAIQPGEKDITAVQPIYYKPGMFDLPLLYRFDQKSLRYYFTLNEKDNLPAEQRITFYPSVTTIIEKTTPTSFGIKKLISDMGMKDFYRFMKERAHYGTLLHTFIADYLRSADEKKHRWFDSDDIPGRVALYVEEHHIEFDTSKWAWELHKDLRSLIQFIWDYEVEPLAIELPIYYNDGQFRYAGCIDLLCIMNPVEKDFYGETYKSGSKKGQPKATKQQIRVIAIVDFKSGENGFYQDHETQLHMYRRGAEQCLGIKIDRVYNVGPADWKTMPSYHIKDQTGSVEFRRIPYLLGAFFIDYEAPRQILQMHGKINGSGDMTESCRWISAAEYACKKLGISTEVQPVIPEQTNIPESPLPETESFIAATTVPVEAIAQVDSPEILVIQPVESDPSYNELLHKALNDPEAKPVLSPTETADSILNDINNLF